MNLAIILISIKNFQHLKVLVKNLVKTNLVPQISYEIFCVHLRCAKNYHSAEWSATYFILSGGVYPLYLDRKFKFPLLPNN